MDWFCWWWRWPQSNGRWLGVVGYNCSAASQPNPHGPRLCAAQNYHHLLYHRWRWNPEPCLLNWSSCVLWLYNTTWYQDYDHLQCTIWFQTYIPSSECAGSGFKRGCSWITAKQGEGEDRQTRVFTPGAPSSPPTLSLLITTRHEKTGILFPPDLFRLSIWPCNDPTTSKSSERWRGARRDQRSSGLLWGRTRGWSCLVTDLQPVVWIPAHN